jgi:hypothetical protein
MDATHALPFLPAVLTLALDDLRGFIGQHRSAGLGIALPRCNELCGEPAIAEFVLESLSVLLILKATVAVVSGLLDRVADLLGHVVRKVEAPIR